MDKTSRSSIAVALFLTLGVAAFLLPAAAAKRRSAQVIEGELTLASGTVGGHYRQCETWNVSDDAPDEFEKPVQDRLNDTFGRRFDVDLSTRGHGFELTVVEGPSNANLDILFYSPESGFGIIRPGGERGLVPPGASWGYICLSEGERARFRYEAGPSVRPPTLSYEADIADHSENLELVGRAASDGSLRRLVFQGRYAFASSFHGIEIFRLSGQPPFVKHIAFFECAGNPASADISVWGRYLFYSVPNEYPYFPSNPRTEYNDGKSDTCNNTDQSQGKAGIRVIDISDPRAPRQIKFIETPCGTMNHTLIPHGKEMYIYAPTPCDEDTEIHTPPLPPDDPKVPDKEFRPLNFQVMVIRFDLDDPNQSEVEGTPALTGESGTQVGCHDITVFPERDLAACVQFFNNVGRASLLDITDPLNPRVIKNLPMPAESAWMSHSAFTWDGNYLVLVDSDRAGYGIDRLTPCTARDEERVGALWIYDIKKPEEAILLSDFTLPRPSVVPDEPCSPWEVNMIPTRDPERRIVVVGWMTGGMTVVDLTDPRRPREIAHWQPAPVSQIKGSYFYNGRIYSSEYWSGPGIRVFEFDGFDATTTKSYTTRMNPQTQLIEFRN